MGRITRRAFLGGVAAASATVVVTLPASSASLIGSLVAPTPEVASGRVDPRVAEVIELSRDRHGRAHVDRVAFVTPGGAAGTLPVADAEADDLRRVLASRDFTPFQERGLRIGGQKFVFIRHGEDGAVVHAVRRGELVTVRATPDQLVVATSADGMVHNRAVEAVYQYVRRTTPNA